MAKKAVIGLGMELSGKYLPSIQEALSSIPSNIYAYMHACAHTHNTEFKLNLLIPSPGVCSSQGKI